jgi:hypothetical protein
MALVALTGNAGLLTPQTRRFPVITLREKSVFRRNEVSLPHFDFASFAVVTGLRFPNFPNLGAKDRTISHYTYRMTTVRAGTRSLATMTLKLVTQGLKFEW